MQETLFTIGQNFELGKSARADIPAYNFFFLNMHFAKIAYL